VLKQSCPTKPLKAVALHYQLSKQRKKYLYLKLNSRLDVTESRPAEFNREIKTKYWIVLFFISQC
jgi:hypothetical protein